MVHGKDSSVALIVGYRGSADQRGDERDVQIGKSRNADWLDSPGRNML